MLYSKNPKNKNKIFNKLSTYVIKFASHKIKNNKILLEIPPLFNNIKLHHVY